MVETMTLSAVIRRDSNLERLRRGSHLLYSRDLLLSQNPYIDANRAWGLAQLLGETEQQKRNARLIALLNTFDAGDPEQQQHDLAVLQAGIEAARPGQRQVFGDGFNP